MGKLIFQPPPPSDDPLTVGGFLSLWVEDPDLAGRVFLTVGKPIADDRFRRWQLAADEADDAVQDGLIRACAHDMAALRRADPRVLFAAWLHGLIRNLAREAVRRQVKSRGERPCETESETRRRAGRRKARRGGSVIDVIELPKMALQALTVKEREAFEFYLEGLSTPQIAKRLGVGREAARERLARTWVVFANAVAGVVRVKRSTLRALSLAETKAFSPRIQEAHLLWRAGASYAAIAHTLRCSESAARGLLQRLRRSFKRSTTGGESPRTRTWRRAFRSPPPCLLSHAM